MPQVRKTIQIVDKGKVRFIQINHGVTLGLAANVGTLVTLHFDSKAKISYVSQTDGIVLMLNAEVVQRLSILEYDNNNLGWGIDWLAICFCYVNNLFVVRDHNLMVTHPKGRGYDRIEAKSQMIQFLNANMTMQEKLIYEILSYNIELKRMLSLHSQKNAKKT